MKNQTQGATPPANETKATKELSFGSKVGRGLTKLTELNEAEQVELATSPDSIRSRYAKRRSDLLDGLDPAVKQAVLAAAVAVAPKAAE
jgi:hypothetical protein